MEGGRSGEMAHLQSAAGWKDVEGAFVRELDGKTRVAVGVFCVGEPPRVVVYGVQVHRVEGTVAAPLSLDVCSDGGAHVRATCGSRLKK